MNYSRDAVLKFFGKLIVISMLCIISIAQADPTTTDNPTSNTNSNPQATKPPTPPTTSNKYYYVNVEDPMVISVANFAVEQMQRGSLYAIVLAKKNHSKNVTYLLLLDVVDAHVRHHRFQAQVLIPADKSDWQLVYFTPVSY